MAHRVLEHTNFGIDYGIGPFFVHTPHLDEGGRIPMAPPTSPEKSRDFGLLLPFALILILFVILILHNIG